MSRNTMNIDKAEKIAKQLVKRNVSAFAGPHTFAVALGEKEVMTPAAFRKVRKAFLKRVCGSANYDAVQKMYATDQLKKMKEES